MTEDDDRRTRAELLASLDYAESIAIEMQAVLHRIRRGEPNPQRIASDLLEAHGFVPKD